MKRDAHEMDIVTAFEKLGLDTVTDFDEFTHNVGLYYAMILNAETEAEFTFLLQNLAVLTQNMTPNIREKVNGFCKRILPADFTMGSLIPLILQLKLELDNPSTPELKDLASPKILVIYDDETEAGFMENAFIVSLGAKDIPDMVRTLRASLLHRPIVAKMGIKAKRCMGFGMGAATQLVMRQLIDCANTTTTTTTTAVRPPRKVAYRALFAAVEAGPVDSSEETGSSSTPRTTRDRTAFSFDGADTNTCATKAMFSFEYNPIDE